MPSAQTDGQPNNEAIHMSPLQIHPEALKALSTMATEESVTTEAFLHALLNYAYSRYRRPDSWEADIPFDFSHYDDRNPDTHADRWF